MYIRLPMVQKEKKARMTGYMDLFYGPQFLRSVGITTADPGGLTTSLETWCNVVVYFWIFFNH